MVLINELTVEQINAALLHLQRSKDEVVGGNKGTTIQNISVNNSGGGGNNVDYFGTIKLLARNIETNKDAIDKNTSDIASLKDDMKDIEKSVEETLQGLADNGISDLSFDPLTKQLTITTNDGDTFQTVITQDIGVLSYDSVNNKLVLTTGEQSQEITLPYIKTSEKGSANGVATLDENGRVPYSQLPESAMEFLGQWNASTNTPHLADGTGTNGDFYIVSAGGTVNLGTTQNPHIITFSINDRIVYEGDIAQWVRLPAGQVSSVNGQSGEVVLTASDINYSTGVTIKDKIDANAVQSDWSVTDSSSLAYIKNKPTIPAAQVNSDWNATTGVAQILNKPTLATVATSGKYCDLSDKPTLGTASECNASCFRASTWNPNMNNVGDAAEVYVAQNTVCRKIIMTNTITNVGFRTRVGIGLQRGTTGWGEALLSVGTNDAGTAFYDYKFSNTGVLTAACFCGTASNSNNFNGCSYAQACCDILMGAECCFADNINIPKDAVLHYSFDEVPDYPDGTAVYFKNKDWTDLDSWTSFVGNGTVSVENGILTSTRSANAIASFQRNMTLSNGTIIKLRLVDTSDSNVSFYRYSSGNWVYIGTISLKANTPIEHILTISANSSAFMLRNSEAVASSGKLQIQTIYIGDGSYSTPIIDNANGEWNSVSQSGVTVQGVSGKGLKCFNGNQVNFGAFNLNNNFSVSLWVKPDSSNYNMLGDIVYKTNQFFIRNGANSSNNYIYTGVYNKNTSDWKYAITSSLLVANKYTHIVCTRNGTEFKLYLDGVVVKTTTLDFTDINNNQNNMVVSNSSNTRPQSYDDLLIFDRALSDTEVQALYLNKANTPKYYDINNYDIKNADTTPTQNSTALITSGAVYNAMQGKVSMADVSNGEVPVALCSGSSSVGKSTGCSLTFNTLTGELNGRSFSGVSQYVGQVLGNSDMRYDIALLAYSPIATGYFNEIAYGCCRTLRYNPVTCTLYACNICGNVLNPNTWITVYCSEYAEIKEMGISGLYCFKVCCNCIMGKCLYLELDCALYYAYGRTFLPSTDTSLSFPVLGRCEVVDRDNKNMGEIINEIFASGNTIGYGVTGGWSNSVYSSQTSCVNTRCFQFMFSGQHIS